MPIKKIIPLEDEFFAHIKESLTDYEEAYVAGAWEAFNKKEKKKEGLIFWLSVLSGAAAVFLIGTTLFLLMKTPQQLQNAPTAKVNHQGAISSKQRQQEARNQISSSINQSLQLAQGHILSHALKPRPGFTLKPEINTKPGTKTNPGLTNKPYSDVPQNPNTAPEMTAVNTAPVGKHDNKVAEEKKSPSFQDFLANESKAIKALVSKNEPNKKEDKWALGLMVAPSFGNSKKLNMGYGISMDYALSDKFSLGSGIFYSELAAVKKPVSSGMFSNPIVSAIARSSKSLESTDAQLSGVDIPLEIKYNLSKKIYANVGVSAFAVIDQKQNNNYVQQSIVQQSISNGAGAIRLTTLMIAEKVSEPAPQSEVQQSKYLGFYNFSFGFKQKISRSNTFSVEPFLKIPMKDVKTENLNMVGTGIKLKFDF